MLPKHLPRHLYKYIKYEGRKIIMFILTANGSFIPDVNAFIQD
jgi:hypothetical protein